MSEFPYISNSAKLVRFLNGIQSVGVPEGRVTFKFLNSLGYTSSNDRRILTILRSLAFVDASGGATDTWVQYRDREKARGIMANAVKGCYSTLFRRLPDAHRKDEEALRNFFTSESRLGKRAVTYMVRTFKALCGLADFEATAAVVEGEDAGQEGTQIGQAQPSDVSFAKPLTVNVNIQLTLPETKDESLYENLFQALKKHLLS